MARQPWWRSIGILNCGGYDGSGEAKGGAVDPNCIGIAIAPVQSLLRKVHAGHIGDLIVWLLIGAVAIGVVRVSP